MLHITIELWPGGDPSRRKTLATGKIVNDASGDEGCGNYYVQLQDGRNRLWRQGIVIGFPRKRLLAWDLLLRALANIIGDRNKIQPDGHKGVTENNGTPSASTDRRNQRRAESAPDRANAP